MIHAIVTMTPANAMRCFALPAMAAFVYLCACLNEWLRRRQVSGPHRPRPALHYTPRFLATLRANMPKNAIVVRAALN